MKDRSVIHPSSGHLSSTPKKPREASRPKVARSTTKNRLVLVVELHTAVTQFRGELSG